jgi:hypothetical protein
MSLPSIEFKYTKSTEKSLSSNNSNTNTNTINNNIILSSSDRTKSTSPLPPHNSRQATPISNPIALNPIPTEQSTTSEPSSPRNNQTPDKVKVFKETFMKILISYFKNNIILLNNLVELSEKIITKIDDLQLLIAILLDIDKSNVLIECEELEIKCCSKFCSILPRYRKINDIIINNKSSFIVSYNQYYIQLQTVYDISLDYVMF